MPQGVGRPVKFKPEMVEKVDSYAGLGFTMSDIAQRLNITVTTLHVWYKEYPELSEAIKRVKGVADDIVEHTLFEKATGYKWKEKQVVKLKDGNVERYEIVEIEKFALPDTVAIIFWLKNRRPKEWRDKQEIDISGNIAVEVTQIDRESRQKEIDDILGMRTVTELPPEQIEGPK